jgi:hypothetical protein
MSDPAKWNAALDAFLTRRKPRRLGELMSNLKIEMPGEARWILGKLLEGNNSLFDVKLVVEPTTRARTALKRIERYRPRIAAVERHIKTGKTIEVAIGDAAAELGIKSNTLRATWKKYGSFLRTLKTKKPNAKAKKPIKKQLPKLRGKAQG